MIYVLSTLVVPIDFDKYPQAVVKVTRISLEEAKELLQKKKFTSAVGHESTARLLSQLLGVKIRYNRRSVFMKPGDIGIHFFPKTRIPEGTVLNQEELKRLDFWLVKSEVLKSLEKESF